MLTINAQLFAAVGIARSYEETRYYLNGVHFEKGFMAATDGHLLTVAHLPDYDGPSMILPASKKAIAAAGRKGSTHVTWVGDILTVHGVKGTVHMEPCAPIDGTFPAWRRILPAWEELLHSPSIWSSEVMGRLCDTARTLSTSSAGFFSLRSAKGDPYVPHLVRYGASDDVFSVAMPGRATAMTTDGMPAWAKGV